MKPTPPKLKHYLDLGFSIIPIDPDSKKALVSWKPFQIQKASLEQVEHWLEQCPNAQWAVVTGEISGITVVDCDNDAALEAAHDLGLTNGCGVSTPRGQHFYFKYNNDGKIRKTISGHGSKGTYWPQVKGLDLRNNGGYALLPPSTDYEWDIEVEDIQDEITLYQDWPGVSFEEELIETPMEQPVTQSVNQFGDIDLTNTSLESEGKTKNLTREKFKEIAAQFPEGKIPRDGSGIHDATYNFLSEEVLFVGMGPALEQAGQEFMSEFFTEPLRDGRFETSLRTIRDKEFRNHPERFNENGIYTYHLQQKGTAEITIEPIKQPVSAQPITTGKYLTDDDAEQYAEGFEMEFWQRPWLPKNSIIQVYGYSGHGKSLFLQHALHHASKNLHCGPFERTGGKPNILYLDFENGKGTWGRRVAQLKKSFGGAGNNLKYWAPWVNDEYINLREPEGINALSLMLQETQPDILVIDTLRSAFPGLKENSAEDWSAINQLALKIRNAGCTVIMVHHSNKPDKDGLGREAGSSNQLTTLETQVRITQVMEDADLAKTKGAIFAGDLPANPFIYMRKQMPRSASLTMVFEISYGKVREWTDEHEPKQYMGLATLQDGRTLVTYSDGPKERLKKLINAKYTRDMIVGKLGRPVNVLEKWAKDTGINLPK